MKKYILKRSVYLMNKGDIVTLVDDDGSDMKGYRAEGYSSKWWIQDENLRKLNLFWSIWYSIKLWINNLFTRKP